MPQIGGARLAEQMAVERPQTKVLFVSGYAENTLLRQGIFDVANRFLQKPFTLKSMASKVREILASGSHGTRRDFPPYNDAPDPEWPFLKRIPLPTICRCARPQS